MRNLLITGADHDERMKYATFLATKILCQMENSPCSQCHNCQRVVNNQHPNLIIIEPDDAETADIKIDAVRRLIEESQKANFEAGMAVFIITHMHQITKSAANALLKSLEESPKNKIFLALAPSRTAVLPTIASRLVGMLIKPQNLSPESCDQNIVKNIKKITSTPPTQRFSWCEQFPTTRPELLINLNNLIETCHQLLRAFYQPNEDLQTHSLPPAVVLKLSEALHQALALLNKNANPRLVTEDLLLSHWPYAHL